MLATQKEFKFNNGISVLIFSLTLTLARRKQHFYVLSSNSFQIAHKPITRRNGLVAGQQFSNLGSFGPFALGFFQIQRSGTFFVCLAKLFFELSNSAWPCWFHYATATTQAVATQELIKGFKWLLVQLFALITPQNVSIVHGKLKTMTPFNGLGHTRGHETSRRIPCD